MRFCVCFFVEKVGIRLEYLVICAAQTRQDMLGQSSIIEEHVQDTDRFVQF